MYIDRILYPITSLGPGNRIVLWVSGCHRRCLNCANPELWDQKTFQKVTPEALSKVIHNVVKDSIDGLTITGGEPFNQAKELCELIDRLNKKIEILIFTGYTYEELLKKEEMRKLLSKIDVLIDGEYVDALNDNHSALRGSSNQRIIFLTKSVEEKYDSYLKEGRKIQNFVYEYKTVSVGIHNRNR